MSCVFLAKIHQNTITFCLPENNFSENMWNDSWQNFLTEWYQFGIVLKNSILNIFDSRTKTLKQRIYECFYCSFNIAFGPILSNSIWLIEHLFLNLISLSLERPQAIWSAFHMPHLLYIKYFAFYFLYAVVTDLRKRVELVSVILRA